MKRNLYYEHGNWILFWGIFLNGRKTVQKVLDEHNRQGWKAIQFEWGASNKYSIIKLILIILVTFLTFGILSYWTGFSIIFEKDFDDKH